MSVVKNCLRWPRLMLSLFHPQAQEIWLDAGHNLQWEAPAAVIATIRKAIQVSQGQVQ